MFNSTLVNTHGVVPKVAFQETFHSSNSGALTALLTRKFRAAALEIRRLIVLKEDHLEYCDQTMQDVFNVLCKMLGTPPTGVFSWSFYDANKKHHSMTFDSPQQFYDRYRSHFDDTVCLVNDPRHTQHELLTVEHLGNMIGGRPVRYTQTLISVKTFANAFERYTFLF